MLAQVFAFALFVCGVQSAPMNLITDTELDHVFLEVGFTFVGDDGWKTITTKNTEFTNDVVVFISIPEISGETNDDGYPISVRMSGPAVTNDDNTVSFEFKLVHPNDSFCDSYEPDFLEENLQVSWIVVEKGAYAVGAAQLSWFIDDGPITRANSNTDATNFNGNIIRFYFPTGCDAADPTAECALESGGGAVTQIQTNNNVKEEGKDFFLTVRAKNVVKRFAQFILAPHDAGNYPDYLTLEEETLAYWAFDSGTDLSCIEGLVFESHKFTGVTSVKVEINYNNVYDYPPGIYGMIGTVNSLADSTGLRAFDRTSSSGSLITQEDKCDDEETEHTTAENVFAIVIGEVAGVATTEECKVRFNSATITDTPSAMPSATPSLAPSPAPTVMPTLHPTANPTANPTASPTGSPSAKPTTAMPTIPTTSSPTGTCADATQTITMRLVEEE